MEARDRGPVLGLIRATGFFTDAEVEVAEELLDIYLGKPGQTDYHVAVIENGEKAVAGYMTWGPTPLAEDAYDIYWMAVAPSAGRGGAADWPFLKNISVGMLITWYLPAASRFLSTSILQNLTLPLNSSESLSIIGLIMPQGRHQGAQKSTTTGRVDLITCCSKSLSVISSTIAVLLLPRQHGLAGGSLPS